MGTLAFVILASLYGYYCHLHSLFFGLTLLDGAAETRAGCSLVFGLVCTHLL